MFYELENFYSDLVDEKVSSFNENDFGKIVHKGKYGLTRYEFFVDKKMEQQIFKPQGNYVTINCSKLLAHLTKVQDYVATEVAFSLRKLILKATKKSKPFLLVVGLGNKSMVADSLGALVAENLLITHHIPELLKEELGDLASFIPGVGGVTGLETFDIIAGVVSKIKPDVILAIDALTAIDEKRLGCSFQMSDSGIQPGAGVGNDTKTLNFKSIGVPVIALGVPMMVSGYGICKTIEKDKQNNVFAPKEVDILIEKCARTLSVAINLAVHGKVYKDYC